ncbi:Uncharacterized membrane protein HdeD, DUF308 family [bacterium A37T11]|nr:Uncharacterized membrane protein HdeD, DUF308 family [bacterium A37T11]
MEHSFMKSVKTAVKHWYLQLIMGIIFIFSGIWTFSYPLESYLTLSILFTTTFIVTGFLEIIFSFSNQKELDNWGWILVSGIVSLLIGILLVNNPLISITTLPIYVGFLVLYRSILALSNAIDLKNYGVRDWGNLLIIGIIGTLFSFILLWNPTFAGFTIVTWTALALIMAGIFSVYLSLKLKKLKNIQANRPSEPNI